MKKLSVLGMLILVAMFSFTAKADIVTLDGANEIANAFFANSASSQKRALKSAAQLEYAWDSNSLTQTGSSMMKSADEDPTFYVFNNPDGEGFVIVSGDSNTRSVIGYSYEGSVPMADEIPDPMKDYLLGIDEEIKWARENITSTGKNLKATLAETGGTQEQYLETPSWGQNAPFNNLCPIINGSDGKGGCVDYHAKTGCVPTAFASVMRYHKWPVQGIGTILGSWTYDLCAGTKQDIRTETIDHAATTYDWENMPMTYSGSWTEAQKTQVATLMRNVGYAFGVEYLQGATNYNEGQTIPTLVTSRFGYTYETVLWGQSGTPDGAITDTDEWISKLKESLINNCPIPYGAKNWGTGDSRHMFVVDGYTSNNYFHFNFGWTGSGNGWFLITAVTPSTGDDYSWKTESKHRAYINFRPNKTVTVSVAADPATAGSVTINGASVTSKEVEAGTQVTLQATGNNFYGWMVGNDVVSTENPYIFTATATQTYTAKFLSDGNTVEIYHNYLQIDDEDIKANCSVTGLEENGASYPLGVNLTITANCERGYKFNGWYTVDRNTSENILLSTENPYSFETSEELAVISYSFTKLSPASFTVTTADETMGTATWSFQEAQGDVYAGEEITLTATPKSGYMFSGWSDGTSTISNSKTCTVAVEEGKTYTANFALAVADYTVSNSTGTFSGITYNSRGSVWTYTTTDTNPVPLQLATTNASGAEVGAMTKTSTNKYYVYGGDANSLTTPVTYTLSVPDGFVITGYELNYIVSSIGNVTVSNEQQGSNTPTDTKQYTLSASNLSDSSTSFTLTGTANSYYITITSFVVTVASVGGEPEPEPDPEPEVSDETLALIQSAKTLVAFEGIGYPAATAKTTLQSAIATAEANPTAAAGTTLQTAIDAYYATTDIVKPEASKTYTFIVGHTSQKSYIYNNNGVLSLATYSGGELPSTAHFTCEVVDGKYQFVSGGKYMPYPTYDNGNLQTVTRIYTKFTVGKILNGGSVTATNQDLFGLVYLEGTRYHNSTDKLASVVVKYADATNNPITPIWDAANTPFAGPNNPISGYFTSAIKIEEVTPVTPTTYTASVTAGNGGTATVMHGTTPASSSITVTSGTEVTFTASANTGYDFLGWTKGASATYESTDETYNVTVTEDISLTANFAKQTFTVSATPNGTNGTVTVSPNTSLVEYGTEVTFTANANPGYRFVSWSNDETANPYITTITANTELTATFEAIPLPTYNVNISVNGNGSVEKSAGSVLEGGEVTLTATAEDGYEFTKWSDESTENPRTITSVTANINLTAYFEAVPQGNTPLLTFACLSDLHAQESLISGDVNSVKLRESVTKTLSKIKEEENVDLIVLGGDYTSNNTILKESWEKTRELLVNETRGAFNGTKTPVIYVNGNHEYEVANYDALPKSYNAGEYYGTPMKTDIGALAAEDCFYETASNGTGTSVDLLAAYHYVVNGFDFVVLNTGKNFFASASEYSYSIESVNWCASKLAEIYASDPNKTVFFLVHVPFSDSKGISNVNKGMNKGADAEFVTKLKTTLAKYPNLIMLYGHDHGTDSAYIRTSTDERVTEYATDGSKYTEGAAQENATYYIENFNTGKYLGYSGRNISNTENQTSDVTITTSTYNGVEGAFNIYMTNAPNDDKSNPINYLHCGSSGRFSGNNANNAIGQQVYLFEVADPNAEKITATQATSVVAGKTYMLVAYSEKAAGYYALTNEMYNNDGTINQRMVGAAVTIADDGTINYTRGTASVLWTINKKGSAAEKSFFSSFMGSMRYYSNSFENGQIAERRIIQALMVYVYSDRVELKMKNYGDDQGDVTANGITVKKDLTPYISYRTVTHSAEAVTATPTITSTGGDVAPNTEVTVTVDAPEWHNLYYTINGETPTEAVVDGQITFTANEEGDYTVKVAAQEGIRLMSPVASVTYTVVNTHGITVSTNGEGGTASFTIEGDSVILTASPKEGYDFLSWTLNGNVVAETAEATIKYTADAQYIANFAKQTFTVNVSATNGGTVKLLIAGEEEELPATVEYGTEVIFSAEANQGYQFVNWTDASGNPIIVTDPEYTHTVKSDITLTANFDEVTLEDIYEAMCKPEFTHGGNNNNTYISAATINEESITVPAKVTLATGHKQEGATAQIPVYAGIDYVLDLTFVANWGDIILYQIVNGKTDDITPIYGPYEGSWANGRQTTEVLNEMDKAGITVNGSTASFPLTFSNDLNIGDLVVVRVVVGNDVNTPCPTGITEGGYVDFLFVVTAPPVRTVKVASNNRDLGYPEIVQPTPSTIGQSSITTSDPVTVRANIQHDAYCRFVNWTINDVEVGTDPDSYTYEGVAPATITANFVETCMVSVSSSDVNMGTATMSVSTSVVDKNVEVTFIAEAAEGCKFVRWTNQNGQLVSEEPSYTTAITSHTQLIAEFAQKTTYNVVVHEGTAIVGETVVTEADKGETVTITATAKDGYEFVNWTSGGDIVSTDETFTVKVVGDIEITANFRVPEGEGEPLPNYCTPSGQSYTNNYLTSVTTSGASENISYSASSHPGGTYKVVDGVIKVTPGASFTLNLVAKSLSTSTTSVYEDIRYCHASLFTDFDINGDFGNAVSTWGAKPPTNNIKGNYDECMNISAAIEVPADAVLGKSYIRVIYTNAWADYPTACTNALDKGIAYDIEVEVVASAPTPTPDPSYFTNFGTSTRSVGGRNLTSFAFNDGYNTSKTITVNQPSSNGAQIFFDKTSEVVVLERNVNISSSINWTGSWMHSYFYIDFDNDGAFERSLGTNNIPNADSELLAFSFWSGVNGSSSDGQGYDHAGSYITGDSRNVWSLKTFKIPAGVDAGIYRARFKIDWNNVDANDVSSEGDAPCVVDFMVKIIDPISVSGTAGEEVTIKVKTDVAGAVTANGVTVNTQAGVETSVTTTIPQGGVLEVKPKDATIIGFGFDDNMSYTELPETVTEIELRNVSEEIVLPAIIKKVTVVSDAENNVAKVSKASDLSQGVQVVVEKEIKTPETVNGATPTIFNFLSMPFAFNTANIEYLAATGWAKAKPEEQIRILLYDSQKRANGDQNTWRTLGKEEYVGIAANQGFVIVGSKTIGQQNQDYKMKLRFTSATEAYNGSVETVTAKAYRNESGATSSYDTDWNFNGVPFLTNGVMNGYTLYFHTGYAYNSVVPAIAAETPISAYQGVMYQAKVTNNISKYIPVETASVARNTNASEDVFARAYISVDDTNPAKIILCDESSENFVVNEDAWYLAPTADVEAAAYFNIGGANASVTVQPAASELPMTVYTGAGTQHRITLTATDGNYDVYLKDAATDEVVCLNDEDYTFTATAKTTIANRFTVSMIELTGIIEAAREEGTIKAVVVGDVIKLYGTEEGDEVTLYNTNGMVITNTVAEDGVTSIATSAEGVIIIKVAEETVKVVK